MLRSARPSKTRTVHHNNLFVLYQTDSILPIVANYCGSDDFPI